MRSLALASASAAAQAPAESPARKERPAVETMIAELARIEERRAALA